MSNDPAPLEDGEITEDDTVVAYLSPKSPIQKPCRFAQITHHHPHSNKKSTVTPRQLDQAKDIVLDLLGWGVTPEYLVDCGVSSQAIYRIFGDLRLRLPKNIDKVAS